MPVNPLGGSSLPSQTGHSGQFLTTNGTTASWTTNASGNVTGAGSSMAHALTSFADLTGKVLEAISTITVDANNTLTGSALSPFILTTLSDQDIHLSPNGTGVVSITSPLAMGALNGQILIGNTAAPFSLATLTAGANITITSGAGSIAISSTGGSPGFPSVDYNGTARVITTADRATCICFDDTSSGSSKTATLNYNPIFGETGLYIYNSAGNQNGVTVLLDGSITAALEPPMPIIPPGGYAIITECANGAGFPIFSVVIVSNVGNVLSTVVNGITTTTQLLANNPANRVRIRNILVEVVGTIVGPTSLNIVDSSSNIYISIPVASLVTGTLVTASNTTFINATNYGNLISNKTISATFAGGAVASGSVNIDLEYVLA